MNDFLSRNWPTVLVAAFIILALSLANWVNKANQPGTGLEFKLVSISPLRSHHGEYQSKLKLLLDDQPVSTPQITVLQVRNTGSIPIEREDYETPIQIKVAQDNDAKIIGMHYDLIPEEINTEVTFESTKVTLTPALFNPGDMIFIHLLTAGAKPDFRYGARIKGIDNILSNSMENVGKFGENGWVELLFFTLSLFVLLLLTSLVKNSMEGRYVFMHRKTAVILFVTTAIVSLQDYFGMLVDNPNTFFSTRMLFLALFLLVLLIAWWCIRALEDKND